jgi:K+-transporting ATPase KdpF subunit
VVTDLILVAGLFALLGVCRLYVAACARIADERETHGVAAAPALLPLATGVADWAGLALAVGLFVYLLLALLRPERF